ncbi:MAG: TRAP transporter fused permease subunit [Armatimonadota bacterium]|nr:TRAP transporter fused permease subunit [Armatimonadota bacterium]
MTRTLARGWDLAAQLMLGGVSLYYLWLAWYGVASLQYYRGIAVLYSLVAPMLLYRGWRRAREDAPSPVDLLLAAGAIVGVGYWVLEHEAMAYRAGAYTAVDVWMGVVVTLVAIEAARRVLGWSMALVAILPVAYALFGQYLPPIVGHRGFTLRRVIEYVYLTSDGVFGIMAEVLASFIIPFVVFGAFLQRAGVGRFFIDLSLALFGRIAGGPAQAAVLASAFFGTINGSPVANTVTTGSITIPLMKRTGFPPHIAAAVEGAASTGGMVLPPVMGAGAFIMAEMTAAPYAHIVKIAAIPGILYFLSVGLMVYLESRKLGLRGMAAGEVPSLRQTLRRGWYLFLPIGVLVALLVWGLPPERSAVYAILTAVAVSWVRQETRMGARAIWEALVDGARSSLFVAALTGAVGILIGVLALTGIGIRFSYIVVTLAGGKLWLTLLLVALSTLILGLALPITATYLIVAVIAVPVLRELGVSLLVAHMIVFWLSLDSNITPPVALGPFAAAAIAGADPMRAGWNCFRFAKIIYVMPILFAYSHLLLTGSAWENTAAVIAAALGTMLFSTVSTAYLVVRTTLLEWLALAAATVLAYLSRPEAWAAALALFAGVFLLNRRRAGGAAAPGRTQAAGRPASGG